MNIKNLYEAIGSDYPTVLERFCGHDEMLARFTGSFLKDATFQKLADAVRTRDYPEVESQAHALKGVTGNLGFDRLHTACGALVSSVRFDRLDEVLENFQIVEQEYAMVCDKINDMIKS